jgi:hypothetical protein
VYTIQGKEKMGTNKDLRLSLKYSEQKTWMQGVGSPECEARIDGLIF